MTFQNFLLSLLIALASGVAIGAERQRRNPLAGIRTNALVSVGAALFVMISALLTREGLEQFDPTRVVAQVVSGIGFLGAGVILREGLNVRGVNTAATLWGTAAIGSLAGLGFLLHAAAGTVTVLFINIVLRRLARLFDAHQLGATTDTESETVYRLEAVCRPEDEQRIRLLLARALVNSPISLRLLETSDLEAPNRLLVRAELAANGRQDLRLEELVSRLSIEQGVSAIRWRVLPYAGTWHLESA